MKISSVEEMRDLDKTAIEKFGIPQEILMENAGQAVYFVIHQEFGIKNKKFVVFCGIGNNGGDGLVVARKIHSNGGEVIVYLLGDPAKFTGSAKTNWEVVTKLPIQVQNFDSRESIKNEVLECDAIVDAVFGTGLTRKVEGKYKEAIHLINQGGKPVFSVDIPSGISGDTGQIMGTAVRSDYSVTFGLPKLGNMLYPGFEHCGKLHVTHISFPPALYDHSSFKVEISLPTELPPRDEKGHKGTFGDVLFVAGASSYLGAPYFSAMSFLKAGGGYSRLAAPSSLTPFLASKGSEIVFVPLEETSSVSTALSNKEKLLELTEQVNMVVMGPGLSLNQETQELVRQLAREIQKPLLIDGDGITAISEDKECIKERQPPTILTPHPGEMSRLAGASIKDILANQIPLVQNQAKNLNAYIVLKGAHSLIACPDERVFINMSGNSGMATAGSGDVLTGTIAAMFGLGLDLEEAVKTGVFLHGFSGDLAAVDKGEDGITAQDILDYLPEAVKLYRENYQEAITNFYESLYIV
ncbi:MAG: NAD(P)H-hydrate dehydratase [Candidatus Aminicenantes bacterium]|nr:NAD(P)H-hydrate dehydratase [Candidatus Aminicenantes bacterium]